ncbi:phosphatases II [Anaeromyces robustus]|uniref:Phosphatases II n=1 Tax=Anaeromyces robustus TaxID=1754192 RepID=A0A1Y1XNY8_9FUNG|nr:phosphatases II [Anaeromyces robustus]|eukprot:ORX87467.1 phosphatases II [Anaeromyces robustus]
MEENCTNLGISKKKLDELLAMKPFNDTFAIRRASLRKVETINTTITGRKFKEKNGVVEELSNKSNGYVVDTNPDTDCCEVVENLFIGSQDAAAEEEILNSKGITHIVNVGTGIPNMFEHKFKYFKVDILDTPEFDILPFIEPTSNFIDNAIKNENGKVLVHCNAGVSRSSAILIGYLMKKRNYTYEEALEKTKLARSCICPNFGFAEQLRRMNKNLNINSAASEPPEIYYNNTSTSMDIDKESLPLMSSISEKGNKEMYLVNEQPLEIEKIDISNLNPKSNDTDLVTPKTV